MDKKNKEHVLGEKEPIRVGHVKVEIVDIDKIPSAKVGFIHASIYTPKDKEKQK